MCLPERLSLAARLRQLPSFLTVSSILLLFFFFGGSVLHKRYTHIAHRDPLLGDLRNPLWVVALAIPGYDVWGGDFTP